MERRILVLWRSVQLFGLNLLAVYLPSALVLALVQAWLKGTASFDDYVSLPAFGCLCFMQGHDLVVAVTLLCGFLGVLAFFAARSLSLKQQLGVSGILAILFTLHAIPVADLIVSFKGIRC